MGDDTDIWEPADDEGYERAHAELSARFEAWAAARGDAEVEPGALEAPVHYKWSDLDGHLTRWTCDDLEDVYLELYPAKVLVDDDELDEVLPEAKVFVTFLSETGLLAEGSDPAVDLLAHLGRIEGRFLANMADVSRHSFGKRLWASAAAEGIQLDDPAAVDDFIQRFNARPQADRDALLGGRRRLPDGLMSPARLNVGLPHPGRPGPSPKASGRFTLPGSKPAPPSGKRRKRRR